MVEDLVQDPKGEEIKKRWPGGLDRREEKYGCDMKQRSGRGKRGMATSYRHGEDYGRGEQ